MESMQSPDVSGQSPIERHSASPGGEFGLVVCVDGRGGTENLSDGGTVFGVGVSCDVVAAPVNRDTGFHPTGVDVVLSTWPLDQASQLERIPASRVDVVVAEEPAGGPAVAFVTLAQPCDHLSKVARLSPEQLEAAIQETGDLWPAVAQLGKGAIDGMALSPDEILQRADGLMAKATLKAQTELQVKTHTLTSVMRTPRWCCWVGICCG